MYVQRIKRKRGDKVYTSTILAENYRENGKVKRRIITNLSKLPEEHIAQLQLIIKGHTVTSFEDMEHYQGKACGALITIKEIAKRLGIIKAIGTDRAGQLALFQIAARLITQRSRLYAAKDWQKDQAIEEVLGIEKVAKTELYDNLDWLSEHQDQIEEALFRRKHKDNQAVEVYLYDVTSSYVEGDKNELAEYGYNRDKKRGKKQIVIGLLCDKDGDPISAEVFQGNTQDPKTVANQLNKLKRRFGVERVVFVGDKGMLKTAQIEACTQLDYHYISSITKPQIKTLVSDGILQMELFDQTLSEVHSEGIRYIFRRNPFRQQEVRSNREQRINKVLVRVEAENDYLQNHPRAKTVKAQGRVEAYAKQLRVEKLVTFSAGENGTLCCQIDEAEKQDAEAFDGCYVIKTDLDASLADAKTVHDRYKDLTKVEQAFCILKTGLEEIRPIFVRKASRTRAHVFVCMLAYKIMKYIWETVKEKTDLTQKAIMPALDRIQYIVYRVGNSHIKKLPSVLNAHQQKLLNLLNVKLPHSL